jgi:hypothetical protein
MLLTALDLSGVVFIVISIDMVYSSGKKCIHILLCLFKFMMVTSSK